MVTQIHGIGEKHLKGVTFTLRHAQAAMLKLCDSNTILVGHALNNDLQSLKFAHDRVVDTAILYRSPTDTTCSLRELAVALLGSNQENPHDSISDAQIAYRCAAYALTCDGPLPLVEKFSKTYRSTLHRNMMKNKYGNEGRNNNRKMKNKAGGRDLEVTLLVHRLPPATTSETVESMFVDGAEIKPVSVGDVEFGSGSGPTGKCYVSFRSKVHCDLAFQSITGRDEEDPTGMPAKRVWLETPSDKPGSRKPHIKLRKLCCEL
jgi:RNA exonuclease 1